jgi:hypothetical protein
VRKQSQALRFLDLVQAGEDKAQFLPRFVFHLLKTHTWLGKPGGRGAICLIEAASKFIEFHLWPSLSS